RCARAAFYPMYRQPTATPCLVHARARRSLVYARPIRAPTGPYASLWLVSISPASIKHHPRHTDEFHRKGPPDANLADSRACCKEPGVSAPGTFPIALVTHTTATGLPCFAVRLL